MLKPEFIYHKGRKIIFSDYSRCNTMSETLFLIGEADRILSESNDDIYSFLDFTNTYTSSQLVRRAREFDKKHGERIKKRAAIGVTGAKLMIARAYNQLLTPNLKVKHFSSKEEALDYLTSDIMEAQPSPDYV